MNKADIRSVVLIGLGVTGSPIAHKMSNFYGEDFALLADGKIRDELERARYHINGEPFSPTIISNFKEWQKHVDVLIVCVKNYDLGTAIECIKSCIDEKTIIIPLQNGIYSHKLFKQTFPNNFILEGYVQGPNTQIRSNNITYLNPGVIHIGSSLNQEYALEVFEVFEKAGCPIVLEKEIKHMVWKKWMLNVAGNSVTALTEADYDMFKEIDGLEKICRKAMREFEQIAICEGVKITSEDMDDVIEYYMSYTGSKKTSMLEDFMNRRRTENDYLAGYAAELAKKHGISAPIIETLYYLVDVKEKIYLSY